MGMDTGCEILKRECLQNILLYRRVVLLQYGIWSS
jgi:hypothetical protein